MSVLRVGPRSASKPMWLVVCDLGRCGWTRMTDTREKAIGLDRDHWVYSHEPTHDRHDEGPGVTRPSSLGEEV